MEKNIFKNFARSFGSFVKQYLKNDRGMVGFCSDRVCSNHNNNYYD